MNIAIVGATGNVGRKLIEVLEKKNFPITEAYLVASSNSEGKKINFLGKEHTVSNLEQFDFSKVKIDAKEISVNGSMDLVDEDNNVIGELRSGCYNPTFKQVIGIAMINTPHLETTKSFKININGSDFDGKVCDLPFI